MGALSLVLSDKAAAGRALSQLKRIARALYSNPPVHGARIVAEVVGDEAMFEEWKQEMEAMAGRIKVGGCGRLLAPLLFRGVHMGEGRADQQCDLPAHLHIGQPLHSRVYDRPGIAKSARTNVQQHCPSLCTSLCKGA